MVFGRKLPNVKVMFQGTWVSRMDSEIRIGNFISTDRRDDTIPVNNACNYMYAKLDLFYCQFSKCSPCVLYMLCSICEIAQFINRAHLMPSS